TYVIHRKLPVISTEQQGLKLEDSFIIILQIYSSSHIHRTTRIETSHTPHKIRNGMLPVISTEQQGLKHQSTALTWRIAYLPVISTEQQGLKRSKRRTGLRGGFCFQSYPQNNKD